MRIKGPKNKDQDGKPISNERIKKYEPMCHFMVRKYIPALNLYEASMDYSDLINQCRYEVMMALANFSSEKALSSFRTKKALDENGNPIVLDRKDGKDIFLMIPDEDLRKSEVARKAKNPELALRKAEECIVYGRLNNYIRRVRWKYSPQQRGGRTVNISPYHGPDSVFSPQLAEPKVENEKQNLLNILEEHGEGAAKEAFNGLPQELKDSVLELIESLPLISGVMYTDGESEIE